LQGIQKERKSDLHKARGIAGGAECAAERRPAPPLTLSLGKQFQKAFSLTLSEAAFRLSLKELADGKESLYMWCVTFKDVIDVGEASKRWNKFLERVSRVLPDLKGLRVKELHPGGHGVHYHFVTDQYFRVEEMRACAEATGFGRIHVKRVKAENAVYLAKYLSKARPKCFAGHRLWAGFGKWKWARVSDIVVDSAFHACYRALKEYEWNYYPYVSLGNWREKLALAFRMVSLTIEWGWEWGKGPDGIDYWQTEPGGSVLGSRDFLESVCLGEYDRRFRPF